MVQDLFERPADEHREQDRRRRPGPSSAAARRRPVGRRTSRGNMPRARAFSTRPPSSIRSRLVVRTRMARCATSCVTSARALGASDDDVARAERDGYLPLLALEQRLLPGADASTTSRRSRQRRVSTKIGCIASGARPDFPTCPRHRSSSPTATCDAAREIARQAEEWGTEAEMLLQQVRVTSSAATRIASVEAEILDGFVTHMRAAGRSDDDIALAILSTERLERLEVLLAYLLRLQLRSASWRAARAARRSRHRDRRGIRRSRGLHRAEQ